MNMSAPSVLRMADIGHRALGRRKGKIVVGEELDRGPAGTDLPLEFASLSAADGLVPAVDELDESLTSACRELRGDLQPWARPFLLDPWSQVPHPYTRDGTPPAL